MAYFIVFILNLVSRQPLNGCVSLQVAFSQLKLYVWNKQPVSLQHLIYKIPKRSSILKARKIPVKKKQGGGKSKRDTKTSQAGTRTCQTCVCVCVQVLPRHQLSSGQCQDNQRCIKRRCAAPPVSLNLATDGPPPNPHSGPQEAQAVKPYCFDSCTHPEVMQNAILMYTG